MSPLVPIRNRNTRREGELNAAFAGQNKSAIIADLMLEAVEQAKRKQRSHVAIERILSRRETAPTVTAAALRKARDQGRP